jgi:hypothetical protein
MAVNVLQFGVARLSGRKDGHPNRPATPFNFRTTIIGDSDMKQVSLINSSEVILIDDIDFGKVSPFNWRLKRYKNLAYASAWMEVDGRFAYHRIHRLIMNPSKRQGVDHINHDGLDNRRCNLRLCTEAENARNSRLYKNNKSGYKGVRWHTRDKVWQAAICVDRQHKHLGSFFCIVRAVRAYNEAAKKYHGEFAYINKI